MSKQQAYASHVQMRRPSMTARLPLIDAVRRVEELTRLAVHEGYHALRRDELCRLKVEDFKNLLLDYLEAGAHGRGRRRPLPRGPSFRSEGSQKTITAEAVHKIVRGYSKGLGFKIGARSLRAVAATYALDHQADITKVQEWLGHANITRPQNDQVR